MTHTLPQGWTRISQFILKDYYLRAKLELPDDMSEREFVIQPLGYSSYVRNLSFHSESELLNYLNDHVPLHLYYSTSKYMLPSAKRIEDMGWLGSDLLFDLDADDVCSDLKRVSFKTLWGEEIEYSDISKDCMDSLWKSTLKLVEILEGDLGLRGEIHFSGNRGYHVVVRCNEQCLQLQPSQRKEIADYVTARGVRIDSHVTGDIRRLVRVPNSVHGKSGLLVRRVSVNEGGSYDPFFNSPIQGKSVFKPWVTVDISPFGHRIKLASGERAILDSGLAFYLHMKMLGEISVYFA